MRRLVPSLSALVLVLSFAPSGAPAANPTEAPPSPTPTAITFGTLSNFDVFNDTGEETHGFEIELDGISSGDVSFTFGEPYQRYGNPRVEDFAGGVYVRYESPYDPQSQTFTAATPLAPAVISPTDGHACWTGGAANYPTSGCEHFGIGLNRNPTATVYRWLLADPQSPGALRPAGSTVRIPAPVWNVSPAPPQAPNQQPVVAAAIEPPPPGAYEFGDAVWVKVFKTEAPEPAELHHLVTDDPAVPQEAGETEIEWTLLQARRGRPAQLEQEAQIGEGNESVTRRYEFYEYTGEYDAESHEALVIDDSNPSPGELGNYIGAQMAAVNLDLAAPTPTPTQAPTTCAGDCNGDGTVTVNEIITGVTIALGSAPVDACAVLDADGDGQVAVNELILAVQRLLTGCA
ncbi:PEP-CTERM sorting domain-containing protein [bacterium]|nr:PEP-CTERM sorting domain-containing protein [bacterium]